MVTVRMLSEISLEGVRYYGRVRWRDSYGDCIGIWHMRGLVVFVWDFFDRGLRYGFEPDLFRDVGSGGLFDMVSVTGSRGTCFRTVASATFAHISGARESSSLCVTVIGVSMARS